jgi:hypothetical protein
MAGQVETKVQASTAVAAVSGLALWALGKYVFKGDVPDVVASWIYVIVPGVLTFAAGYLAKHTDRPAVVPARQAKTLLPPGYPASGPPMTSMPPTAAESATLNPPAAPE